MRYFLLIFALAVVTVMGVFGKRGRIFKQPPLEIFTDMDRQPKLRPQQPSLTFANGRSSQEPVPGAVARGDHYESNPINTARVTGTTNFVAVIPVPVTEQLMARGKQRFDIYCLPCHGPVGDGNGIVKKYGYASIRSLHEKIVVAQPDGELFNTITHGKNTMYPYGSQISIEDRWAIVAYVRALQRSRLGVLDEVPAALKAGLK
ncbi:MAG TPA: cytochrome c [Candidatus Limnocylindria bacterium]|nr:cytochrome c [Candidatus Limnocylindria bacterium]